MNSYRQYFRKIKEEAQVIKTGAQRLKPLLLIIGPVFLLVALLCLLIYPYLPKEFRYRSNLCLIYQKYECHVREVRSIAAKEGIKEAIEYVKIGVAPRWGFGLSHMMFHRIGEDAFYQIKDVSKALSLIDSYISDIDINIDGFDGYQHGVFRGYFKMNSKVPVQQLMQQVCPQYYSLEHQLVDKNSHHGSKAEECFHGIGHALMYLNYNNVNTSLNDCR